MPKVVAYLDCGCAILEDGVRVRCPTHDWELEKQFGESQQPYPTQEELATEEQALLEEDRANIEIDWVREQAWDTRPPLSQHQTWLRDHSLRAIRCLVGIALIMAGWGLR